MTLGPYRGVFEGSIWSRWWPRGLENIRVISMGDYDTFKGFLAGLKPAGPAKKKQTQNPPAGHPGDRNSAGGSHHHVIITVNDFIVIMLRPIDS